MHRARVQDPSIGWRASGVALAATAACFLMLFASGGIGEVPPAPQALPCSFEPPYPATEVRSRLCVRRDGSELQLVVLPVEERREVLRGPYCGGDEGDVEYVGRYRLVALLDGRASEETPLPGEHLFNPERPEYGLEPVAPPSDGTVFVGLRQYAGCNNARVELYRFGESNDLGPVEFVDPDGVAHAAEHIGILDEIRWSAPGEMTFCRYDNSIGRDRCNVYRYDGEQMVRIPAGSPAPDSVMVR